MGFSGLMAGRCPDCYGRDYRAGFLKAAGPGNPLDDYPAGIMVSPATILLNTRDAIMATRAIPNAFAVPNAFIVFTAFVVTNRSHTPNEIETTLYRKEIEEKKSGAIDGADKSKGIE